MKKFGVYILKSLKNSRYYIGSTDNLEQRFKVYSSGFVKSTKNIRPLTIQCFMECNSLTEARSYEYQLKKYKCRDILEKIIRDGIFPWNH